jgi:hypothetical protein
MKASQKYIYPQAIHEAVAGMHNDRRVKQLVGKMHPPDLQDDLFQHCILEIYRVAQKCPGKVEGLVERNEMFAWFSQVIKLQMTGSHSTFFRKYRRPFENIETLDYERPESPTFDIDMDSKGGEISDIEDTRELMSKLLHMKADNDQKNKDTFRQKKMDESRVFLDALLAESD